MEGWRRARAADAKGELLEFTRVEVMSVKDDSLTGAKEGSTTYRKKVGRASGDKNPLKEHYLPIKGEEYGGKTSDVVLFSKKIKASDMTKKERKKSSQRSNSLLMTSARS